MRAFRGAPGTVVVLTLAAALFTDAALAGNQPCGTPNAPPDAPGGPTVPVNPGSGTPVTTGGGGGGGPTTAGPGVVGGRRSGPVDDLPPATTDPSSTTTSWVRWWERNKDEWLRYAERMRRESFVSTPGAGPTPEESAQIRREQDAVVRQVLVPVFEDALTDSDPMLRATAAVGLGRSGDASSSKALRERIDRDANVIVRETATMSLGLLGRMADVPYLAERLEDRSLESRGRGYAAFSLGLIGGDDAADVLAGRVRKAGRHSSNREDLDCATILALGLTKTRVATQTLLELLGDRRYRNSTRAAAIVALGRMEERLALPEVAGVLRTDPQSEVRAAAALALGTLAGRDHAELIDDLVESAARDRDAMTRHFAALSLGRIGGPRIADRLQVLFVRAKGEDRPFAALALGMTRERSAGPALREAFEEEKSDSERSALAIALGLHGDPVAIPALRGSLASKRAMWHQAYAATALAMLGDTNSSGAIRERMLSCRDDDVRQHLAVALGLLGDERAAGVLEQALRNERDPRDRGAAAMALGLLRLPTQVPRLAAIAGDRRENRIVRACALSALAQIADPLPVPRLSRVVANDHYGLGVDAVDGAWVLLNRR